MKKMMENLCTALEGMQVSEVELVYKTKIKATERLQVSTSKEVYELLKRHWDENKIEFVEQFKILLLNRANKVLGIYEISTGGLVGTVADPKLIFIAALRVAASHIILAHNHPSGNLNPSIQDKQLTQKIKEGGKLLEIMVMDHLIISKDGYYSFADEGWI